MSQDKQALRVVFDPQGYNDPILEVVPKRAFQRFGEVAMTETLTREEAAARYPEAYAKFVAAEEYERAVDAALGALPDGDEDAPAASGPRDSGTSPARVAVPPPTEAAARVAKWLRLRAGTFGTRPHSEFIHGIHTTDGTADLRTSDLAALIAAVDAPAPTFTVPPPTFEPWTDVDTTGDRSQISDGYHTFAELYRERCALTAALARTAQKLENYESNQYVVITPPVVAWVGYDEQPGLDGFRNVLYIELDDKQVSWHFSDADAAEFLHGIPRRSLTMGVDRGFAYDGHSTEEKHRRVEEYARG